MCYTPFYIPRDGKKADAEQAAEWKNDEFGMSKHKTAFCSLSSCAAQTNVSYMHIYARFAPVCKRGALGSTNVNTFLMCAKMLRVCQCGRIILFRNAIYQPKLFAAGRAHINSHSAN